MRALLCTLLLCCPLAIGLCDDVPVRYRAAIRLAERGDEQRAAEAMRASGVGAVVATYGEIDLEAVAAFGLDPWLAPLELARALRRMRRLLEVHPRELQPWRQRLLRQHLQLLSMLSEPRVLHGRRRELRRTAIRATARLVERAASAGGQLAGELLRAELRVATEPASAGLERWLLALAERAATPQQAARANLLLGRTRFALRRYPPPDAAVGEREDPWSGWLGRQLSRALATLERAVMWAEREPVDPALLAACVWRAMAICRRLERPIRALGLLERLGETPEATLEGQLALLEGYRARRDLKQPSQGALVVRVYDLRTLAGLKARSGHASGPPRTGPELQLAAEQARRLGRWSEAIRWCQRLVALEQSPPGLRPWGWATSASCYQALGMPYAAYHAWMRASRLARELEPARAARFARQALEAITRGDDPPPLDRGAVERCRTIFMRHFANSSERARFDAAYAQARRSLGAER